MNKLFKTLRDPIWGGLGVLITAFFSLLAVLPSTTKNELSIIPSNSFKFSEYWLPSEKIRLSVSGITSDLNQTDVSYFLIKNSSQTPIKAEDFKSRLTVETLNKNREVILVSSCTRQAMQSCTTEQRADLSSNYPTLEWQEIDNKWVMTPSLFNGEDTSCVIVITKRLIGSITSKPEADLHWDGRILNATLKIYSSTENYETNRPKGLFDYLTVYVFFQNFGIIWFMVFQYLFFAVSAYIAGRAGWITNFTLKKINLIYLLIFFSITTSEIIVSIFINNLNQNPVVWPLLAFHLTLFIYLLRKALRKPFTQHT